MFTRISRMHFGALLLSLPLLAMGPKLHAQSQSEAPVSSGSQNYGSPTSSESTGMSGISTPVGSGSSTAPLLDSTRDSTTNSSQYDSRSGSGSDSSGTSRFAPNSQDLSHDPIQDSLGRDSSTTSGTTSSTLRYLDNPDSTFRSPDDRLLNGREPQTNPSLPSGGSD